MAKLLEAIDDELQCGHRVWGSGANEVETERGPLVSSYRDKQIHDEKRSNDLISGSHKHSVSAQQSVIPTLQCLGSHDEEERVAPAEVVRRRLVLLCRSRREPHHIDPLERVHRQTLQHRSRKRVEVLRRHDPSSREQNASPRLLARRENASALGLACGILDPDVQACSEPTLEQRHSL
eukprot:988892-Rhodomonas_salina.1